MAATIKIKNSSTASAVPTSSDLVQGELAVNVTDKRIFTENASGTVVELGTNPTILTLPDGSASAPTLTNDGDTNTGIFFPAADTVGITTGGTERARVDSSGNLGIGTSSPSYRLDAQGTVTDANVARIKPLAGSSSTTVVLDVQAGDSSTLFKVLNSGNAGLGVTPLWASGKGFEIGSNGNALASVNSTQTTISQNAYHNGTSWTYARSSTAVKYQQYGGSHTWQTAGSGTAGAAITFTDAMTLDASGNLGIGTTSPAEKLHISGKIAVSGTNPSIRQTVQNAYLDLCGGTTVGTDPSIQIAGSTTTSDANIVFYNSNTHIFRNSAGSSERARIDSSGNLLVGVTGGSNHRLCKAVAQGTEIVQAYSTTTGNVGFTVFGVSNEGYNAAATSIIVGKNSSTSRSINAGGTVNASGADYAEYMTKAGDFTVAKGDVVGINAEGKLTNVFADAVSFAVKSTDPSYVGGDVWGNEAAIGLTKPADDATQEEKDAFNAALEAARQTVDRIAFAGQVPVNVTGATAGQYIVPVNDNGTIKGQAVSNPTFEQYQQSVGKVIAIEQDGRARIIVKVA